MNFDRVVYEDYFGDVWGMNLNMGKRNFCSEHKERIALELDEVGLLAQIIDKVGDNHEVDIFTDTSNVKCNGSKLIELHYGFPLNPDKTKILLQSLEDKGYLQLTYLPEADEKHFKVQVLEQAKEYLPRRRKIPAVIGCPLVLFLCIYAIPYVPVFLTLQYLKEWRLRRKMFAKGRFITWIELESHLQKGEGTLIVEQAYKQGHRVWWTSDMIRSLSPFEVPSSIEDQDYMKRYKPGPFALWCFRNYLSTESGKALLIQCTHKFPVGFIEIEFLQERYPELDVVMTVKLI